MEVITTKSTWSCLFHPKKHSKLKFCCSKLQKDNKQTSNCHYETTCTMFQIICIAALYVLNPSYCHHFLSEVNCSFKNKCILFAWDTSASTLWILTTYSETESKEAKSLICYAMVLPQWQWVTDWLSSSVLCNWKHVTNTSVWINISGACRLYLQ